MRIISGKARGTNLFSPLISDTRPTLDRVREAIFSMLFDATDDAEVLDLFAGSGAMGLESLSRGAKHADFVDANSGACETVRKNIEKTRLLNSDVFNCDFKKFLNTATKKYSLIFLDPPYEAGYYGEAFSIINARSLLAEDGIIVAESSNPNLDCGGFEVHRMRKYGKVFVYILKQEKSI